jgi:hypothetical protein
MCNILAIRYTVNGADSWSTANVSPVTKSLAVEAPQRVWNEHFDGDFQESGVDKFWS